VGRSYWITSSAVANSVSGMVRPSNFAALRLTTKVYVVSHEAESPYFSVTQAQSITSGLPVYNAGGGWQAVGAGTQIKYRFNSAWATYGIFEYDKLVGATPIVTGPGGNSKQRTFGLGLTYSFAMTGLPF
jgi:outer membrane scaffolding protein for murein synthesis (MipA/OmpV family)